MKRGQVYWAELSPRSGSEQKGRRPVILMPHDSFNENPRWRSVIVVPLSTSPAQAQRGPSVIKVRRVLLGLNRDGVALCHQITTLDRAKFGELIGTLTNPVIRMVEAGIRAAHQGSEDLD